MKSVFKNILFALLFFAINTSVLIAQNKYPGEINFRMGLMVYAFDEVNFSDGNAALQMWMESTKKSLLKKGVKKVDVVYRSYEDLSKLEEDVTNNHIDLFSVKSIDFFRMKRVNEYIPFFAGTRSVKSKFENFIIVTNKKSGYKNLSDIVSGEITTAKTVYEELSTIWAEVAIKEASGNKLKKAINFESTIISESNLLLGVFFGKYKCAVVSQSVYDVVCELNPRVKSDIIILATSGNLINNFFARKKDIPSSTIEILDLYATDLHEDGDGRQILSLFKVNRVEKIYKNDIEETRKIIQKHKSFFKSKF